MSLMRSPEPVRIGLVSEEPMRLAGLVSIFDQPASNGNTPMLPVTGTLPELVAKTTIEHLVVDIDACEGGVALLYSIRRARPSLKVIVIGPEGNDELVLETIIAGARAYLDISSDITIVRHAVEVVAGGSIWAPRRLLAKLVDRLLKVPDGSLTNGAPYLTAREKEVLELILMARSNREIARQLGIEERTVKAHVGHLMRKTGADNRIELSMRAMNLSLLAQNEAGHNRDKAVSRRSFPRTIYSDCGD